MSAPVDGREASSFRGYWSVMEVRERLASLAEWYEANRPGVDTITMRGKDFDLLVRWPNAAKVAGFTVEKDQPPRFGRFTLARNREPERYQPKPVKRLKVPARVS